MQVGVQNTAMQTLAENDQSNEISAIGKPAKCFSCTYFFI
jgi:hypothetical protein